ncbi:MAG: cytochrome c oxidase subunit 2A [Chloroflexi bacterium]|nr:cytochrome c oxidase subunit 2A [Chloroflexota bacterium]
MKDQNDFEPKGAMAFLLIFVVTLIILWGSVYLILLSRGITV